MPDEPAPSRVRHGVFSWYYERGFLWFRVFGHGLLLKDTRRFPLMPSERFGYESFRRLGRRWIVRRLRP